MKETLLQIPAELVSSATRSVSKTTKLTFESQENVPPELISKITENIGRTGWLCWLVSERKIDALDVISLKEIKGEKDKKSKAERLRAALYILWQKEGEIGSSEEFYQAKMERFIDHVKEKIKACETDS